jgi:hypothetical protein
VNFDHLQGYFGNSSFEALALGRVNVVGVTNPSYHDAIREAWGAESSPPWICADTIEAVERRLLELKEDRAELVAEGIHAKAWHQVYFKPAEFVERLFVETT